LASNLRGKSHFNVEQIENLPDRFFSPAEELPTNPVPHIETVETFVKNTGAIVRYGGTKACYRPGCDDIHYLNSQRVSRVFHYAGGLRHRGFVARRPM
jgi:antirestriction protein ArdC